MNVFTLQQLLSTLGDPEFHDPSHLWKCGCIAVGTKGMDAFTLTPCPSDQHIQFAQRRYL